MSVIVCCFVFLFGEIGDHYLIFPLDIVKVYLQHILIPNSSNTAATI